MSGSLTRTAIWKRIGWSWSDDSAVAPLQRTGGLGILATLIVAAGLGVLWSGVYTSRPATLTKTSSTGAFDTTMQNSVQSRAEDVQVPARFSEEQVKAGFGSFDEMCVLCHGAPGVERTEWANGMRPIPPPSPRRRHTGDRPSSSGSCCTGSR